ncbi:MAG: hypothetical protein IJ640_09125 [Prevotella sp.]|nr:hypothetical protein [Prevotella sp.]
MGAKVDLANQGREKIVFGLDSVIIRKYISGIIGGRTLEVPNDYPLQVIYAGHAIITDGNGLYKPMPIVAKTETTGEGDAAVTTNVTDEDGNQVYVYGSLPSGYSYAGVLYRSVKKSNPQAAIMTNGEVNSEAVKVSFDNIKTAFLAACPHIVLTKDEEA